MIADAVYRPTEARQSPRLLATIGLCIALLLPAMAVLRRTFTPSVPDWVSDVLLVGTPWILIGLVLFGEKRARSSIGLRRPDRLTIPLGLLGAVLNLLVTFAMARVRESLGIHDAQSAAMGRLLDGPHWYLFLTVINGALLAELVFRGYAIERASELLGIRLWKAALLVLVPTSAIYLPGYGLVETTTNFCEGLLWSLLYLWRRDVLLCFLAHALPSIAAACLITEGIRNF